MRLKHIINLYLIIIFTGIFIFTSCGKKSEDKIETTSKEKWGGVTKDEYVKSPVALSFAYDVLREFDQKGPDSTILAKQIAECIYDSQTDFLEKKYPEGPIQKNYDYRINLKNEDYEIILNNCIKKLGLNK
jgi:hypothetical protein